MTSTLDRVLFAGTDVFEGAETLIGGAVELLKTPTVDFRVGNSLFEDDGEREFLFGKVFDIETGSRVTLVEDVLEGTRAEGVLLADGGRDVLVGVRVPLDIVALLRCKGLVGEGAEDVFAVERSLFFTSATCCRVPGGLSKIHVPETRLLTDEALDNWVFVFAPSPF